MGIAVSEGYGVLEGRFVGVAVRVAVAGGVKVLVVVGRIGWNGVAVAGFSKNNSRLIKVGVGEERRGRGRENACA